MNIENINKSPLACADATRASKIELLNKCTKTPTNSPSPHHISFYIRNILHVLTTGIPIICRLSAVLISQQCEV